MNYQNMHDLDLPGAQFSDSTNFDPQLLAAIPDSLPGLIACVDCNMRVKYCNEKFREWSSFNAGFAGWSFPLLVGNSLFDQIQRQMGCVLTGQKVKFQAVIRNTPVEYLDVSLSPQFDSEKRVAGFVFYAADVTAKAELERGLSDYFENASICLHWVDENGIIVWANPTELKTLGYEKEEYVGKHISEFHAKPEAITDILTRLGNREILRNVDAQLVCKDGSVKNVLVNSSVFCEADKFIHTRCFTIDVTEQKRAADAARQTDERFRQMANLVPLVIWTTDANGNCNYINNRWVELTGRAIDDGLGEGWMNFIHPDDRGKIRMSWLESIRDRNTFEAKMRLRNSESSYTTIYINCRPQLGDKGDLIGYIGIFQDISSQEEVKDALEQMVLERTRQLSVSNQKLSIARDDLQRKNVELIDINGQLSSFAHIASHDLQEPLRKIQTLLSFLFEIEGKNFSPKGTDLFNRINDSSKRMRALIQDLLTYASNEISTANFEVLDLNEIVTDVLSELDTRVAQKKAVISVGKLPALNGVKFQIHQLFLNLVSNALKFTNTNTRPVVNIYSQVRNGHSVPGLIPNVRYCMIVVKDNGIGFEAEYGSRIFEMFQRLHRSQKYEGTGIGLAICKKVVDNHKGFIVADSAPGFGATFSIFFPITNEQPETGNQIHE